MAKSSSSERDAAKIFVRTIFLKDIDYFLNE